MNHKNSNSDSGEIDDLVMDSMMRSYGRSSDDSEDFLENVLSKIDSVEEKKHQRSVFGRPSLLDAAGLRSEAGHRQEPAALVSSSTTENRSWLLPIITTVALVSAVAFATAWWVTNSNHSHERSQIADKSVVEPDSRNELTTVNALALEPPKDQIASAVIEESANAKLAEVSQKQNLGSENQPSEKEVKEYIKETVTNFHSGFPVPDFPFWTLEINFLENGVATAKLNDENFGATFNFLSADLVLARISHEVARRVHFVSPILEEQWSGAVFITGPDMSDKLGFVGIDEMHQAFCKSREIVKNMRAQFKQTFDKPAWQKLNHPIVSATTNKTEQLLRNIAPDSHEEADLLFLRMMGDSKSKRFKNYRTISQAELLEFFQTGELNIPLSKESFVAGTEIQNLNSDQLKTQLSNLTEEIGLFRNKREFQSAIRMLGRKYQEGFQARQISQYEKEIYQLEYNLDNYKNEAYQLKAKRTLSDLKRKLKTANLAVKGVDTQKALQPLEPILDFLNKREDLEGLQLVMGDACHLDENSAKALDTVSDTVSTELRKFDRFGTRDFSRHSAERHATMKNVIRNTAGGRQADQSLGTIDQMLQIENPELRLELVETLHQTNSATGCSLLTRYAKYDLDPKVRIAAVDALRSYPPELYRPEIMAGFEYPWPEVAKHSAEALVRLNDTDAIPELVEVLKRPDPRTPRPSDGGSFVQPEVVAINHMKNCMLCHADSQYQDDPGRALIPQWDQPLPFEYYQAQGRASVRADITYLRQDFSVIQPVEKHGPWPEDQRFDYVVRMKPMNRTKANEVASALTMQPNQYHSAVAKALRMLTNENPDDDSYTTWKSIGSRY